MDKILLNQALILVLNSVRPEALPRLSMEHSLLDFGVKDGL